MPTFNYLPGTITNYLDGGLASAFAPSDEAILVLGTAGDGVTNTPIQIVDLTVAANEFGVSGSLYRGIAEARTYSDNVQAVRIGAKEMQLTGIGLDTTVGTATPGFSLQFNTVSADAGTRYQIWYKAGVLAVWRDGTIVYSNQAGAAIDQADIVVTSGVIAGNAGLELGSGSTPLLSAAITVTAAAALTGTQYQAAPVLVAPVDGTGLSKRQVFLALQDAFQNLAGIQVLHVYAPDAMFDNPNVAFYVSSDATTAKHNPATNPDALDWLKITKDAYNNNIYQWASDTKDSSGATVTAMSAVTAAARITAGFYEVNFGHALGNFCAEISQLGPRATAYVGCLPFASVRLTDTRTWVGFLPTYDPVSGNPTRAGGGLLGNPYLSGTTASKLNTLCSDYANGYRKAGLFVTENGCYDGPVVEDGNGYIEDAGAYLHIVADYAWMSNSYQANYVQNIAGLVASYASALDQKSGLTGKPLRATQAWKALPNQLDALTQAKINVLTYQGVNKLPAMLHDLTAATAASDWTNLVRVRCMGLAVTTLRNRASQYVGESTLDGLTLASLQTQLDQDLATLKQRGYITNPNVTVTSTLAQQRIGHAVLTLKAYPADELIQLTANVGIGPQ